MLYTQNRFARLPFDVNYLPGFLRFVRAEMLRAADKLPAASKAHFKKGEINSLIALIKKPDAFQRDAIRALYEKFQELAESVYRDDPAACHFAYAADCVIHSYLDPEGVRQTFSAFLHLAALRAGTTHEAMWDFYRDGTDSPLVDEYLAASND